MRVSSRRAYYNPNNNTAEIAGYITLTLVDGSLIFRTTTAARKKKCLIGKTHEKETCWKTVITCI